LRKKTNFCACGCGVLVAGKWKHGHHNRVNNISKRPDIRKKRSDKLKEQHANGERPPIWNKGLTKEDPRIKAGSEKALKSRANNETWRENAAKALRRNRITQHGENHWNWKGGTSDIVCMLRGYSQFYKLWKKPILKRDNFTCQHCGQKGNLNVHHDKITMADIIKIFVPEDRKKLTFEQKVEIRQSVIDFHTQNNVSGVSLCELCHKTVHEELKVAS
jgi:hypothetical protein